MVSKMKRRRGAKGACWSIKFYSRGVEEIFSRNKIIILNVTDEDGFY